MISKSTLIEQLATYDFSHPMFDIARNDKDIALEAIKKDPQSFADLGWNMQNDPHIIELALEQDGSLLELVPAPHCYDEKNVSLALESCPAMLDYLVQRQDEEEYA